ncbi:enoyl-CoA hydratase-related protein [Rhodococcus wratislaviensis]|uniref:Putative enoyl-CoA hydratase n=1 Tax=Rhodococcus wratislaviensis NBRC 100605 TaxID=1219028 RepID=X0PL26_RHOWR|nr:enoyl-CoA hydratase-related protein [Rhodococcus wratislaviensis]GAF43033.1 putative enoyl-CoA hydratase [Rhodococcus wratislaviensis NBRC 100605]
MDTPELIQTTLEVTDGVALIELRNAGRRNAWNGRMAGEYRWLLHHCDERADVRAVVVTGAGDDFCVGADFRELESIGETASYERPRAIPPAPFPDRADESLRRNHMYPLTLSVPVIAAIQGGCAGAGFVVSTYADFRVVDGAARVSSSYAGLGLPAEYGIGWMLPRIMGTAQSAVILLDNEPHSGSDVYRMGWAQYLSEGTGSARARAVELATRIARSSAPSSIAMMKRQLYVDAWREATEAYVRSVSDMDAAVGSADFRRSVAARRKGERVDFRTVEPKEPQT